MPCVEAMLCNLILGALLLLPVNGRHAMVGDASGAGERGFTKIIDYIINHSSVWGVGSIELIYQYLVTSRLFKLRFAKQTQCGPYQATVPFVTCVNKHRVGFDLPPSTSRLSGLLMRMLPLPTNEQSQVSAKNTNQLQITDSP